VGLAGAGAPTTNPSGNANYIVYKGVSAAGGGIELDIFLLDTLAEAKEDFGESGIFALEPDAIAQIGADDGWIYLESAGNDPGTTFAELRVLKGKAWFMLGIPTGPQARDQLLTLAQLVLGRGAALFAP
jgi:hypothetical protein